MLYKYKCRYCWDILEKEYEIKKSYCSKKDRNTILIKL